MTKLYNGRVQAFPVAIYKWPVLFASILVKISIIPKQNIEPGI